MKILVLGGTGAMGVPVVKILAERGNEVFVTTRRERKSDAENVSYIMGDAQNDSFLQSLLQQGFDVLIDFMIYDTPTFERRMNLLLSSVKQYFFFSSSRVYADAGDKFITEDSPRLLDVSEDEEYLKTDEYALAKAREENLLKTSGHSNWTIIRPYITYNDERLQLGVMEKEIWLQRALSGKKIVFSRDIASKYTTLTYGYDVSLRIADLAGKEEALGETFHLTTGQYIKWEDIFVIYLDTLEKLTGKRPGVCWLDDMSPVMSLMNQYQIRYDRLYDRKFDNRKIQAVSQETRVFTEVQSGLSQCLTTFVEDKKSFLSRNWKLEAALDRITGDRNRIFSIKGKKNKLRYILYRYIKHI